MTRTRLIKGAALVAVAVAIGVATVTWPRAEAVLPGWCYNRCSSSSSCSLLCTDPYSGEVITCQQWAPCGGGELCNTVQCAGGCAPKPSWSPSPSEPRKGEPVTFTANTSNINPATCNWDYGDGQHAFGCTTTHTYTAVGVFRACLSANENTCGTVQFKCKDITVSGGTDPDNCAPNCEQ